MKFWLLLTLIIIIIHLKKIKYQIKKWPLQLDYIEKKLISEFNVIQMNRYKKVT